MILTIFEDSNDSNVSITNLLKHCYLPDCVRFAGGNRNVCNYVSSLSSNDIGIIYFDVVPDNYNTIRQYNKTKRFIEGLERFDIIPIPCIEYFVIKAFCNDIDIGEIYLSDYRNIYPRYRGRRLNINSFEKYCKSLIDNYSNCFGDKYLINNCRCSKCKSSNLDKITFADKIDLMLSSLPILYNTVLDNADIEPVSYMSVKNYWINLYNNALDNYIRYGYLNFGERID